MELLTMQFEAHPETNDLKDSATILLVDDDQAILEGVADLLRLYGYTVLTAVDGREAIVQMQSETPAIIISDIMMPDMDGYEFFDEVRSNAAWTAIPFIFLTARGQPKDVRLGNMLGADAYLTKPFDPEDLIVLVQSRLKRIKDIQVSTQNDVERMKQQLITIFSHELRTPLTYIYGYVNLLQEQHELLDKTSVEDMLDGVQRGAERLVKLVEDLMLMVRIDSGVVALEISLRREYLNLAKMVNNMLHEYKRTLEFRKAEVEVDIAEGLEVHGMEMYLRDGISRLIDNAIKFTDRTGDARIRISAEKNDGTVIMTIKDNGVGIPQDKLVTIFERFKQLDRDVMEQQGIGLGLSIAQTIIELHGGTLTLTSTLGEGTTCTIQMPATAVAVDTSQEEPENVR